MREQFGRVENMSIREGQPILDRDAKVVRVAWLGAERGGTYGAPIKKFEAKKQA